ncbi:MAG: hypothetical protein OEX00_04500, partial [Gammaproteobacteria bacterium]|nr:hypothetical protein [Gammaproteobacteria bacterium]
MNDSAPTLDGMTRAVQSISTQAMEYLPKVFLAIVVILIGWLVARLLRSLVVHAVGSLDQLWQRFTSKDGLEYLHQPRRSPTRIIGEFVFWLVLLIFTAVSVEILGLGYFGIWLKEILAYLPLAIGGLLIILFGFVLSSLARQLVTTAAETSGISHGDLLGRSAQLVILLIAIIIGIDQIGFDIVFLSVVAGIILATILGGIALALGLGARTHVSNMIAANQLRTHYQVGDRVRIGD